MRILIITVLVLTISGCHPLSGSPKAGPDKQAIGTWYGAAVGAGSGAVVGAQLGSVGAVPGAFAGAGMGAVHGMIKGLGVDLLEEDQIRRENEEKYLREIAWAQEVLSEHYTKRLELHPNRDIFPADLFFENDGVKIKKDARFLVEQLASMTERRMPWSRIEIAAYVSTADPNSTFANYITSKRAESLAVRFVQHGFDPRRIEYRSVTMKEPLVVDPYDSPDRYRQAIEIIPLDY